MSSHLDLIFSVCDHNSPTPPLQGDNTHSGFVPYARAIIAHIGEFYGCSAADLLTIVAAYGPQGLDAPVDPAHDNLINNPPLLVCFPYPPPVSLPSLRLRACEPSFHGSTQNLPAPLCVRRPCCDKTPNRQWRVQVGRIDHQNENTLEQLRMMHDQLPTEFMSTPDILDYWITTLSLNQVEPPGWDHRFWRFGARDIVGLLGAHTLLDNHGCMEQECGGEKKMFVWNQDWYKVHFLMLCLATVRAACAVRRRGPCQLLCLRCHCVCRHKICLTGCFTQHVNVPALQSAMPFLPALCSRSDCSCQVVPARLLSCTAVRSMTRDTEVHECRT